VLGDNAMHLTDNAITIELPYFLQTIYEVSAGTLLGKAVTLACIKDSQPLAAQHIEQHLKQLRELLHVPVMLALPDVSPGERKQLIQRDIAFVVPDRQLFAPQWGMVLSERFDMAHLAIINVAAVGITQRMSRIPYFIKSHESGTRLAMEFAFSRVGARYEWVGTWLTFSKRLRFGVFNA
jgi:hypothetical protein